MIKLWQLYAGQPQQLWIKAIRSLLKRAKNGIKVLKGRQRCFILLIHQDKTIGSDLRNVVFTIAMACLQMKESPIGITFSQESESGSLARYNSRERGQAQAFVF
jgi:hypothetical protein